MIGERLRAARGRANKTLREVATACGVTPQAVLKWQSDEAMPNSARLMALCQCLDVSVEWIMAGRLDFHSTEVAPQGVHAKYWVREAIWELKEQGLL